MKMSEFMRKDTCQFSVSDYWPNFEVIHFFHQNNKSKHYELLKYAFVAILGQSF